VAALASASITPLCFGLAFAQELPAQAAASQAAPEAAAPQSAQETTAKSRRRATYSTSSSASDSGPAYFASGRFSLIALDLAAALGLPVPRLGQIIQLAGNLRRLVI
jgi:hypothetical protein